MVTIRFGPPRLLRWVFASMEPSCPITDGESPKIYCLIGTDGTSGECDGCFHSLWIHRGLPLPWLSTLSVKCHHSGMPYHLTSSLFRKCHRSRMPYHLSSSLFRKSHRSGMPYHLSSSLLRKCHYRWYAYHLTSSLFRK